MSQNNGAARSRLASRESFFGGPLSTREQSKAPGWSAFAKAAPPAADKQKAAHGGGGGKQRQPAAKVQQRQQQQSAAEAEQERLARIRARRDFSALAADEAPPPPPTASAPAAGDRQQTAAGPPPRQRNGSTSLTGGQQRQRGGSQQHSGRSGAAAAAAGGHGFGGGSKVTVRKAAAAGGGRMATAARSMAYEVTSVGKGRKQLASEALKQRVGEMIAGHSPGGQPTNLGSPSGSGPTGGTAAAAAAAARAAREAAAAKPVMQRQVVKTATGMQTMQLVKRPTGQGGVGQQGQRAAAAGAPGGSPGGRSTGHRSPGGAAPGSAQRRQLSPAERAALAAARGRPQFKGAFYGGRQPPAALEARMHYNKRRLSLDSGASLDSFIANEEELDEFLSDGEEGGAEGDWRAALREATGGYDPSKFAHIDRLGDRDMEAGYSQIAAEERRALRIARAEDEREAEAEARREAAKQERKRAKRSGAASFLDMD